MKIVRPSIRIEDKINGQEIIKKLEKIGRVCYKSEDNIKDKSAERFIANIIKSGHESVIEHVSLSVRVICSRATSHQWVRHRLASYSQESQRYCNYSQDKFDNELIFIEPTFSNKNPELFEGWAIAMQALENTYLTMIKLGALPEEARLILPNSAKTEFVCTMNLREWRHFFRMRCDKHAQLEIRLLALQLLDEMYNKIPVVFNDLYDEYKEEIKDAKIQ